MGETFLRCPLRTLRGRFLVSLPPGGQVLEGTPELADRGGAPCHRRTNVFLRGLALCPNSASSRTSLAFSQHAWMENLGKGDSYMQKLRKAGPGFCIPVQEMVSVRLGAAGDAKGDSRPARDENTFTVFFIQREKEERWSLGSLELSAPPASEVVATRWVTALQLWISHHGITRPKSLLVFINPVGGQKKAVGIYQSRVAPLFALAGIQAHVIETSRANEARKYILLQDLGNFDGLVSVGGDGTFNEVMHALIERTQRKAGVSEEDEDAELLSPHLRIGIIPAGSTDCVCFATVGVNDPVTSALHIIIGDSQPLDVCSIRHQGKLLRYSVSLVGYGFYGDVVSTSEKHRWMGPVRYTYAGAKAVLSNRSYEGTVEFQVAKMEEANPRDQTRCRSGCLVCSDSSKHLLAGSEEEKLSELEESTGGEWQRVRGRFLAINMTSMSSACPKSPEGLSPCAHLADGTADLILVRECSVFSFLRHLARHTNCSDQFDLPFVSVHRVRGVRFTAAKAADCEDGERPAQTRKGLRRGTCWGGSPLSCWTCDGETLNHADISIRVHGRLVHLFARGIEPAHCMP